jgi:hypothetical protein
MSARQWKRRAKEATRKDLEHRERLFKQAIADAVTVAERNGQPINVEGLRNVAKNLGLTETAVVEPPTKREGRARLAEAVAAGRR